MQQESTVDGQASTKLSLTDTKIIDILRQNNGYASAGTIRRELGKGHSTFAVHERLVKLRKLGLITQRGVMAILMDYKT